MSTKNQSGTVKILSQEANGDFQQRAVESGSEVKAVLFGLGGAILGGVVGVVFFVLSWHLQMDLSLLVLWFAPPTLGILGFFFGWRFGAGQRYLHGLRSLTLTSGSNALLLLIICCLLAQEKDGWDMISFLLSLVIVLPWMLVLWLTAGPLALYIGGRALARAESDSKHDNREWWYAVVGIFISTISTISTISLIVLFYGIIIL